MFVDHLLLAVCGEEHHKGVEAGHLAPELVAVHQEEGDVGPGAAQAGEEEVLEVVCLLHTKYIPFSLVGQAHGMPL